MLHNFEFIKNDIREKNWDNEVIKICFKILDFALSKTDKTFIDMTFDDFKKITGRDYYQKDLQQAIALLVSRYSVLEMKLIFIDDDVEIYLNSEEQRKFIDTQTLIHPTHGYLVEECEKNIFPYFIVHTSLLFSEVTS